MRKIKEILRLHYDAGLSNEAVASSLKISKGSVFDKLDKFGSSGLKWPLPVEMTESQLVEAIYPKKDKETTVADARPKPVHAHTARELPKKHVTLQLLYDEFHKEQPDGIGRTAFYEGFKEYMGKHNLQMHMEYKGGDKLFIDYSGDSLSYVDRETGEVVHTQMYVSSWGASSYTYVEVTNTQKGEEWVNSHVRMQEFYGCVAGALVPDNLKAGVIKPSWYDPDINPLYFEMAKHYGTFILPARVRKPKDKAVVESNVLHIQRYILGRLRNRTFFSLLEINGAIRELLEEFNARPMKEYGGQSRKQRFLELDKPFAKPLPTERFSINKMKDGVLVGPDYHVVFDFHHYSVPYALVTERVNVYQTGNLIEIYHNDTHVVRHRKQPPNYRYTTVTEHMPAHHRFIKGINPSWLIFKGGEIGPSTAAAIKQVLSRKQHPEQGYRACLGILRFAKKYSAPRLENACRRTLYFDSVYCKSIKTILDKQLDKQPFGEEEVQTEATSTHVVHDNLRGSQYYAEG